MFSTRRKGLHYEDQAIEFLTRRGLSLVERNYQNRFGEIDLIMLHHSTLCFIEVKFRKNDLYGGAAHSIPVSKQQKITRTALDFIAKNKKFQRHNYRFDAVLIKPSSQQQDSIVDWIDNAFAPQGSDF